MQRSASRHAPAILLVALLAAIVGSFATIPSAAAATYSGDFSTTFPNPERGYHNRYEIINDPGVNDYASSATSIAGFNPDMLDRTFARAKADGNTLIHSYIHLDKYKTTALPQALLDNLNSGLAAVRAAGMKIVLRPAYAWSESPMVSESQMMGHIEQLNAVISANADVISHLEAGYLGPWGEWHTSQFTDPFNRANADVRYRIMKKILSTTPASIPVAIRYPIFIKEVLELSDTAVPTGSSALTQAEKDRIGFHNDCFLSDTADMGTYDNNSWMGWFYIEEKKQWMYDRATSFGGNTIMGGETCDSAGSNDAAGVNVQAEMSKLHFSEINEDYAAVNITIWKAANLAASGNDPAETAFMRIKRKLGYRLRLTDASFPSSASAGGSFTFAANLQNDGWAGPIKPRPLFLVLRSGANRFDLPLTDVDVRTWRSGAISIPLHSLTLPANMPSGTYQLALWLPDQATNLRSRPEYAIRLANLGMWDATAGYNVLANAMTIGGGCTSNCPTATATPIAPTATPTLTPAPFSASYEAEASGNTRSGAAGIAGCAACSGGSRVAYIGWGANNATLQFNGVALPSAGSYNVTIYYTSDAARSAELTVNGNASQTVSFPSTSSWETVGSKSLSMMLQAGTNTIKFWHATDRAPDIDRIVVSSGLVPTATTTPQSTTTATPTVGATATPTASAIATPTTNATLTPTATSGSSLTIDTFSNQTKWSVNHQNDLNQSVSWLMDSIYYGEADPGNIVMNSSTAGHYYQENINQSLTGKSTLVLRLRDWWDSDTENHWSIVLNDGTDHSVALSAYANVGASYTNVQIPLSAFGADLANTHYLRIVHADTTYAVLQLDTISVQ